MSVVGNIVYGTGCSEEVWFLDYVSNQTIGKLTPSYQQWVVSSYLEHHRFNGKAAVVTVATVFVSILVLQLKKQLR